MMNDEWGSGFGAGVAAGVIAIWLLILVGAAVFGHTNVVDVNSIDMPDMYKVTVDGAEFTCKREPVLKSGYIELIKCNDMPDSYLRVMNYSSFAVAEVE